MTTTHSAIITHPDVDHIWPWAADRFHEIWRRQGGVDFIRVSTNENKPVHALLKNPSSISRLVSWYPFLTEESLSAMPNLRELVWWHPASDFPVIEKAVSEKIKQAGINVIHHKSMGYWGQAVSEFALALTLCGLRRIPQTHHQVISSLEDWNYCQPDGVGKPSRRGQQFGDDPLFTNGTLEGKRVRIAGAGNIGSRYASFCHFFGADVSMWDPFAPEPCFHRAGARREHFLERLVEDAEIFAPMLPETPNTERLIKKEYIQALPKGCLVVMVTRAIICDYEAIYERVLRDELSLAADVFEPEPLEIGHPLLGRHNVVHTPHNAGRTKEANWSYAEMLADQFLP